MTLAYIRKTYGVPARRGMRVVFLSSYKGTITGSSHTYLRVLFDGARASTYLHPTREIEYLTDEGKP